MSSITDLTKSKKLMAWIGDDKEDLLKAYSDELRDYTAELMAKGNPMDTSPELLKAIDKTARLMARLSIDMKTIHKELFQ